MFHRFSTWWRALGVVLLGLATVTWPSAALASTSPSSSTTLTLLAQTATATMHGNVADLGVALSYPRGTSSVTVTLYPALANRGQLAPLLAGHSDGDAPVAATTLYSTTCTPASRLVTVQLVPRGASATPACGRPVLMLPCARSSCDGVFPLRYQSSSAAGTTSLWSLVAVHVSSVLQPLHVALLADVTPASTTNNLTVATLRALRGYPTVPVAVGINYATLDQLSTSTPLWRQALTALFKQRTKTPLVAPPAAIDYANLANGSLRGALALQFSLSSAALGTLTTRAAAPVLWLRGAPTAADVQAVAALGHTRVLLSDSALAPDPAATLSWGAPELASGTSATVLATDSELSDLVSNAAIAPAQRAALALGTLAFLHFDAPNDAAVRTVPIVLTTSTVGAPFVADFVRGAQQSPFLRLTPVVSSFAPSLIGSNGITRSWSLATSNSPAWSSQNVQSLAVLLSQEKSFGMGVASAPMASYLGATVATTAMSGAADQRQSVIDAARAVLHHQFGLFTIDNSTVTLTSQGTALPITIESRAHYTMTVLVHVVANSLSFTKGPVFAATLASPTTAIRVPLRHAWGSNVTMQIYLTAPNGAVVLAHTAVLVRVAGTSVVGYLLSGGSLLVLALWWIRTHRRTSKGKHSA